MFRFTLWTFALVCSPLLELPIMGAAAGAVSAKSSALIPTPPSDVIDSALRTIDDPALAAQVRPGHGYGAADCVVHLGLYRPLATSEQRRVLDGASVAWRASLVEELGETGAQQMIGSSVNPLIPTPLPLRQAAAAWCALNAPEQ